VIRVRVPIDLHAIAIGSSAFAWGTPMRLRDLLGWAVREAIGARAPRDKFERSLARTLDGLAQGAFIVEVEGRRYTDADAVVLCPPTARVRFFLAHHSYAR